MYPLLKYAYKLGYTERPDYDKIKFMLVKILLSKNYIPDNKFDWSLGQGECFARFDDNFDHSSISSCDIGEHEQVESEAAILPQLHHNTKTLRDEYF